MRVIDKPCAKSADTFRRRVLSEPTPGQSLYLAPEVKARHPAVRDMIKTAAYYVEFEAHDNSDRRRGVFLFEGYEYGFWIDDACTCLSVGLNIGDC